MLPCQCPLIFGRYHITVKENIFNNNAKIFVLLLWMQGGSLCAICQLDVQVVLYLSEVIESESYLVIASGVGGVSPCFLSNPYLALPEV
jgi:hypothetical protein